MNSEIGWTPGSIKNPDVQGRPSSPASISAALGTASPSSLAAWSHRRKLLARLWRSHFCFWKVNTAKSCKIQRLIAYYDLWDLILPLKAHVVGFFFVPQPQTLNGFQRYFWNLRGIWCSHEHSAPVQRARPWCCDAQLGQNGGTDEATGLR